MRPLDPDRDQMLEFLTDITEYYDAGEFSEFDREEALYWFAHDWHGGQGSNLYEALCASPFQPGPLASEIDWDSPAATLYERLEWQFVYEA